VLRLFNLLAVLLWFFSLFISISFEVFEILLRLLQKSKAPVLV